MKDLVYFFQLSRPINVAITFLAFVLGAFLATRKDISFIMEPLFWWAAIPMLLITATGYWVNDAYDFKIDRLNKPRAVIVNAHLSVKKVLTAYFFVLAFSLGIAFWKLPLPAFLVNLGAAAALFAYAAVLKRTTVIGNVVIASLTASVIYYAGLVFGINIPLIWTTAFAFMVNFIREIVKDIEDIRGDLHFQLQTLPIRIGTLATKRVLYIALGLFTLMGNGPFFHQYMRDGNWNLLYLAVSILLVQLPSFWVLLKLFKAKTEKEFHQISQYLKVLVLTGMVSLLFL